MNRITVRVPASSANLGPGFDSLAMGLALYNTLEVDVGGDELSVEIEGEGEGSLPHDVSNRVIRAAQARCEQRGGSLPGMKIRMINNIPVGSGLGSSAVAAIGGMLLADAVVGGEIEREALLEPVHKMEGHADNAAASLFGGLVLVRASEDRVVARCIEMPELWVALALPDLSLPTREMRRSLPKTVSLEDAAANIGSALLTVEALRNGDYDLLASATVDRLHQPHRKSFIPGFDRVVEAAQAAGAAAVVLSGAGPGLLAFAPSGHADIAAAMVDAFQEEGLSARPFVLAIDRLGATVSREEKAG
jgi:homoserine kinase